MMYGGLENLHFAVNATLFYIFFLNKAIFKLEFVLTVGVSEDDIRM